MRQSWLGSRLSVSPQIITLNKPMSQFSLHSRFKHLGDLGDISEAIAA